MSFHNKTEKNREKSPSKSQSWMLKMVTSYSVFLLVILIMFVFIYKISMDQIKNSFLAQQENVFIGDVKLFEQDFDIMEVYCRQILQNRNFRKLYSLSDIDDTFISLASDVHTSLSVDVMNESLLPIDEAFFICPKPTILYLPTISSALINTINGKRDIMKNIM